MWIGGRSAWSYLMWCLFLPFHVPCQPKSIMASGCCFGFSTFLLFLSDSLLDQLMLWFPQYSTSWRPNLFSEEYCKWLYHQMFSFILFYENLIICSFSGIESSHKRISFLNFTSSSGLTFCIISAFLLSVLCVVSSCPLLFIILDFSHDSCCWSPLDSQSLLIFYGVLIYCS